MNNILLVYDSKKGMTEKLGELLKDNLSNVKMINIKVLNLDLSDYETIIIGSPVYIGRISKKVSKFIKQNKDLLLKKKTVFYLCGMNFQEEELVIKNNFSEEEQNKFFIKYLGGAYRFEKLNFLQKLVVKKIAGVTESQEIINESVLKQIISFIIGN